MFQSKNQLEKQIIGFSIHFPLWLPVIKAVFLLLVSIYSFIQLVTIFDYRRSSHMCFLTFVLLTMIMNILRAVSLGKV